MVRRDNFGLHFITVSSNEVGRRVDNFLITYLKGISKNKIYNILRKGEVRVNKKRVKWLYRLNFGDVIRIPPIQSIFFNEMVVKYPEEIIKKLYTAFLYEDDSLIILNKPSGIAVHGGSRLFFNIIDGLRLIRPELRFLKLVHRLDRGTSGVLLIAKNHFTLIQLHKQLCLNKIKKEYLALVSGQCTFSVNVIVTPLVKDVVFSNLHKFEINSVMENYSKTFFFVKERFVAATLLKVYPITGRTHQIRIHARYMGNPIAFDKRYGNICFDRRMILSGLNRLFLHAHRLWFVHPSSGKMCFIEAPMDKVLLDCLSFLRKKSIF